MHNQPGKPVHTMTNVGYPQAAWEAAAALLSNDAAALQNHQVRYGQSHYTPGKSIPPTMLDPQDQLVAEAAAHIHYGQPPCPSANPPIDQANMEVPMFAVPQQVSHMKPPVWYPMAQVPQFTERTLENLYTERQLEIARAVYTERMADASSPVKAMHVGATSTAVPMMDSARLPMMDVARLPMSGMQVPMKRHAPQPKGARVELSSMLIVLKDMVGPERWMAMGHVMHRTSAFVMQHGHSIHNPKEMKRNMIRGLREIVGSQLWHYVQQQLKQAILMMRHSAHLKTAPAHSAAAAEARQLLLSPTAQLKTARAKPIDPLVPGDPRPVVAAIRPPATSNSCPSRETTSQKLAWSNILDPK